MALTGSLALRYMDTDTKWILGMRGISGADTKLWSGESKKTFSKHYDSLLWYGDESILGHKNLERLENFFSIKPKSVGYVSRFKEIIHWQKERIGGATNIVSLPWMTDETKILLGEIYTVLKKIGDRYGGWRFFTNMKDLTSRAKQEKKAIESLPFCGFEQVSDLYFNALQNANLLITYGGYNSQSDVLAVGVPTRRPSTA